MQRTFAGFERVRVALFQAKRTAPVLEADARSGCDYTAAESLKEAVYKRAPVSLGVYGAQVRRVVAELR